MSTVWFAGEAVRQSGVECAIEFKDNRYDVIVFGLSSGGCVRGAERAHLEEECGSPEIERWQI